MGKDIDARFRDRGSKYKYMIHQVANAKQPLKIIYHRIGHVRTY